MLRKSKLEKTDSLSFYGNVGITRAWCDRCRARSFVFDGVFRCCSKLKDVRPEFYKSEIAPVRKRRSPPKYLKEEILSKQDNTCIYCDRSFGSTYQKAGLERKIKLCWDHRVPCHTISVMTTKTGWQRVISATDGNPI